MNGDEAKWLGEKLLAEVEVAGLSEVLKDFRAITIGGNQGNDELNTFKNHHFNIPELDALIPGSQPPILELVSPPSIYQPSGSGKTSLLYLIIAKAILPRTILSTINLSGHEAAVILFDPLHHFSIARLAELCFRLLKTALQTANHAFDPPTQQALKSIVKTSLSHLHIIHPPSWPSLLPTLRDLPTYLFDATKHPSLHRRIHSLILEDTDAFVPSIRNTTTPAGGTQALPSASSSLTFQLTKLSSTLSAAVIVTSRSTSPRYYRPVLPSSWPRDISVTRLALRRVPVRGFAMGISVEEAEWEREKRWEVVRKGRFECWKVGVVHGSSTNTGTNVSTSGGSTGNAGFVFRVGEGIEVERS